MDNRITFTNISNTMLLDQPVPASKILPEWYINTDSYVGGKKGSNGSGSTNGTIKRCMPVFDALTSGYIITLDTDVYVSTRDGEQFFEWPDQPVIDFHYGFQAKDHPLKNNYNYPKWINPWSIETPKGYSTLFVQPFHRDSLFTIMPGVVDTDKYNLPVNIPFVINDPLFEGLIEKGTPIVQVIPFKRESWKMSIGSNKDLQKYDKQRKMITTKMFDKYKTLFRSSKQYS